jgi:phospholipid/cholesterol/gamma-HCH transport system ATP-binding protein
MAPMTASAESLVQLNDVRIDRGGRAILRDVSLSVPRGSITAVLGPSGSGKSTLRTHTKLPAPVLRRLVDMKLHAVGLLAAADAWPRELSGGMARRVALARALALDPPLMIYDEPLTGLDPIASGVIMSLIQRLNHSLGLTSIIVSHHVHETLPICDQVIAIANGGVVFQGTPAALESSQDPLLRQFLHGQPDGPIPFDAAPRAKVA